MTTENYGIETLKRIVTVGISLPKQAAITIKGKFKLIYLLAFIDEARELAEVLAEKEQVVLEFSDLSIAERGELLEWAKEEFDLPDDKVEIFVENALTWGVSTIILFREAKELFGRKK